MIGDRPNEDSRKKRAEARESFDFKLHQKDASSYPLKVNHAGSPHLVSDDTKQHPVNLIQADDEASEQRRVASLLSSTNYKLMLLFLGLAVFATDLAYQNCSYQTYLWVMTVSLISGLVVVTICWRASVGKNMPSARAWVNSLAVFLGFLGLLAVTLLPFPVFGSCSTYYSPDGSFYGTSED